MYDFLTDWSADDPKYYVVYILVGSCACLMSRGALDFNKPSEHNDMRKIIVFVAGVILILIGLYSIFKDLIGLV